MTHSVEIRTINQGGQTKHYWQCSCKGFGLEMLSEADATKLGIRHAKRADTRSDIELHGVGKGHGRKSPKLGITDAVLSNIGRLTYRTTSEIYGLVVDDLGSVSKRSIHRSISKLLLDGQIVRTNEGYLLARKTVMNPNDPAQPCDHGITFDDNAWRDYGDAERKLTGNRSGMPSQEVRRRWPRLCGECPKGCGYKGIYYASELHYLAGDW